MTSASTKRRQKRDAALLKKWTGVAIGTKVTVHRANGGALRTVTLCEPFGIHAGTYVRVQGINGNTHLRRVTKGWDEPESIPTKRAPRTLEQRHEDHDAAFRRAVSTGSKDAEIQRLRAAMVHAMDDCEHAVRAGADGRALALVVAAYTALKIALEKR